MSFPHILSPEAAQVWALTKQLNDYEYASLSQQRAIQAQSLKTLFEWAHTHSSFWRKKIEFGQHLDVNVLWIASIWLTKMLIGL